jgi:hypothetical protein
MENLVGLPDLGVRADRVGQDPLAAGFEGQYRSRVARTTRPRAICPDFSMAARITLKASWAISPSEARK